MYEIHDNNDIKIIKLGKSTKEVRAKLEYIRKRFKLQFKGTADLSLQEICEISGLPLEYAVRMVQREYGETILQIEKRDMAKFVQISKKVGLNLIHGGRFFDVTIGNDKGHAVQIVMDLFKRKYGADIVFFGLGDSENDISMLNLMDQPILVQRNDNTWLNFKIKNVIKVQGIGPIGWMNGFKIIDSR
jgi:mannosyl-3-phosphoglycerate phosphatase family protein